MKKIISIFICIQIALFPAFAFASNVGGWTLGGGVAQGASVVYEGTKKVVIDGADYIKKGTAKITPTAAHVTKTLAKGAAGYALSVAVEQLLGSVDWVLDPANNQIKYKPKADPETCSGYQDRGTFQIFCSAQDFVDSQKEKNGWYSAVVDRVVVRGQYADIYYCFKEKESYSSCVISYGTTTVITGTDEAEEQTLPLPILADRVISNAENGDSAAQAATTAAAADIVAEAEKDNVKARPIAQQLEASAQTKPADEAAAEKANEATGEAKPNTANPDATDLSIEFPVFCGWAPLVCEASQVVISFPTTITEIWTAVKEWANDEPDLQQEEQDLPIDETPLDRDPSSFDTSYVTFGAQCPVFDSYEVSVGPISKSLSMDLTPLCQFAEKVRPAILGMSYLTAAGIVVAAIRET